MDLTDVVGHVCLFLIDIKADIVALASTSKELNAAVQLQAFNCSVCSATPQRETGYDFIFLARS
jgi:hypothetical protein